MNPDRSNPTIELEFPSYKYQIATLSPRNGLAMQAQTKNEQLLRSCAFQDDVIIYKMDFIILTFLFDLVGRNWRKCCSIRFL
jgi:hypothetical protein